MTTNQGSAPKQSILIIEDETVIRTALVRFLQRQGFDTCEAGTLAAARRFDLRELSLIVTDLRLPDGEGTDVIGHAGNVPVLVMTSYASLRSAVDTMKRGAAEYIAKPFNYDEMLSAIRHLIAPPAGGDTHWRHAGILSSHAGSVLQTCQDRANIEQCADCW